MVRLAAIDRQSEGGAPAFDDSGWRSSWTRFEIVDFDREDARVSGEVRAALASVGTPIGPLDTLIAGQALARGFTVITRNVREFSRVTGLLYESWEG